MAIQSVTTPQISVGAQEFLDQYYALCDLIDRIVGAEGVLSVLSTAFEEDTPENCAFGGAWRLVRDCREKAVEMYWPGNYVSQAERALGTTEEAA